jgi:hypothetical protein
VVEEAMASQELQVQEKREVEKKQESTVPARHDVVSDPRRCHGPELLASAAKKIA